MPRPKRSCASTHSSQTSKKSKAPKKSKTPKKSQTPKRSALPAGEHRFADAEDEERAVKLESSFGSPAKAARRTKPPSTDKKVRKLPRPETLRRRRWVESHFIDAEARCGGGVSEDEAEAESGSGGYGDPEGASSEESVSGDGGSQRAFDAQQDTAQKCFPSMMAFLHVRYSSVSLLFA